MKARTLAAVAALFAAPAALAGPDFVTADRSKPLAASDARSEQPPLDDILFELDSAEPLSRLVSAELDRDAIAMLWTRGGSVFRETRGITPVTAVATRR